MNPSRGDVVVGGTRANSIARRRGVSTRRNIPSRVPGARKSVGRSGHPRARHPRKMRSCASRHELGWAVQTNTGRHLARRELDLTLPPALARARSATSMRSTRRRVSDFAPRLRPTARVIGHEPRHERARSSSPIRRLRLLRDAEEARRSREALRLGHLREETHIVDEDCPLMGRSDHIRHLVSRRHEGKAVLLSWTDLDARPNGPAGIELRPKRPI